jgi:hypothetical protein
MVIVNIFKGFKLQRQRSALRRNPRKRRSSERKQVQRTISGLISQSTAGHKDTGKF